jgi:hypothetical protein
MKHIRLENVLAEMQRWVPWQNLVVLIKPHYPKVGKMGGRPPFPLATMLRIRLMQQFIRSVTQPWRRPSSRSPTCDVPWYGPDQRSDPG